MEVEAKLHAASLVLSLYGAALLLASGWTAMGLMGLLLALIPAHYFSRQRGADRTDAHA